MGWLLGALVCGGVVWLYRVSTRGEREAKRVQRINEEVENDPQGKEKDRVKWRVCNFPLFDVYPESREYTEKMDLTPEGRAEVASIRVTLLVEGEWLREFYRRLKAYHGFACASYDAFLEQYFLSEEENEELRFLRRQDVPALAAPPDGRLIRFLQDAVRHRSISEAFSEELMYMDDDYHVIRMVVAESLYAYVTVLLADWSGRRDFALRDAPNVLHFPIYQWIKNLPWKQYCCVAAFYGEMSLRPYDPPPKRIDFDRAHGTFPTLWGGIDVSGFLYGSACPSHSVVTPYPTIRILIFRYAEDVQQQPEWHACRVVHNQCRSFQKDTMWRWLDQVPAEHFWVESGWPEIDAETSKFRHLGGNPLGAKSPEDFGGTAVLDMKRCYEEMLGCHVPDLYGRDWYGAKVGISKRLQRELREAYEEEAPDASFGEFWPEEMMAGYLSKDYDASWMELGCYRVRLTGHAIRVLYVPQGFYNFWVVYRFVQPWAEEKGYDLSKESAFHAPLSSEINEQWKAYDPTRRALTTEESKLLLEDIKTAGLEDNCALSNPEKTFWYPRVQISLCGHHAPRHLIW